MPNRLAAATSPYLLQHQDNPVDWMEWGDEAFARARAEDKPVLLSVGYAACHWCHVMAHESFEDADIARLMNELFVCIKVDREERPDVDTIYQSALAMLNQPGGWPLTMFLTPDGSPFWGGTYFPPVSRWSRPGFPDVLRGVAETYAREPDKIGRNIDVLREGLARLAENRAGEGIDLALIDRIAERLTREVDPFWGGIGQAPKFPQAGIFELLWRAWLRTRRQPFRQAVLVTLTRMAQGGIYDHLGGGFARYSTDEQWLVPHFEKMLYDNAQLIDLYTLVWQEVRDPLYAQRVAETTDWLLREMVAPPHQTRDGGTAHGGFASTIDADSEGEEGRYYVWTVGEVDALLGPDAALFRQHYDVAPGGNWEGVTILNRRNQTGLSDDATESVLSRCRTVLKAERDKRVRPGWDDKVLADWNGLMIASLANAGLVFDRRDWIDAARRAYGFVRAHMTLEDGRLRHSWREGRLNHAALLEDHANMARAALALAEATGDAPNLDDGYLADARRDVAILDRHHWDPVRGGYWLGADDGERLIVRTKSAYDNAVPSGNGTMVGVLTRLWLLTGQEAYRARAEALIQAFAGEVGRNVFPLATLLNNAQLYLEPTQIVVVGASDSAETRALIQVALDRSLPNRVLVRVPPGATLPMDHPARDKLAVDGRPTAYVCHGPVCSLPVTSPEALAALV